MDYTRHVAGYRGEVSAEEEDDNDSKSARLREKYRAAYTETNRRVKRKIKTDKRAYMEDLAKEAEEVAQKGEQRNVYKVTKLVCGKYNGNRNVPI